LPDSADTLDPSFSQLSCYQVLVSHLLDCFSTHLLTTLPSSRQHQPRWQQACGMATGLPRGLSLPASGQKQEWLAYVAALPDVDQPAVLGLPANIGRSIALGHSRRLLASLRQINAAQVGCAHRVCRCGFAPPRPGTAFVCREARRESHTTCWSSSKDTEFALTAPVLQVAGSSAFDLQQQLPQLQPALKLWDQLAATLSPALQQAVIPTSSSSSSAGLHKSLSSSAAARGLARQSTATAGGAAAADSSPVAAFVALEFELGVSLLRRVAQTLADIQAALTGEAQRPTAAVQVGGLRAGAASVACTCGCCTEAAHDLLQLPWSSRLSSGRMSGQCTHPSCHACVLALQMHVSVLQAAASALAQGQVPLSWDALWEGPASPLDYMRSAVRR
jgi:hypothetical protein